MRMRRGFGEMTKIIFDEKKFIEIYGQKSLLKSLLLNLCETAPFFIRNISALKANLKNYQLIVDIKIDTKSMLRCCQNTVYLFVKWDILWLEYILAMLDICYVSLQFIKRRI